MKKGVIWFLVYLVFGAYFINSALNFVVIPERVIEYEKWIFLVGGFLILLGGINHFRAGRKQKKNNS